MISQNISYIDASKMSEDEIRVILGMPKLSFYETWFGWLKYYF
jgi:hypothetical protein